MARTGSRGIRVAAAVFALLAAALLSFKPLIMDEVLTLIAARQATLWEVLMRTREHAGNVPLGFLIEHVSLRVTGYSAGLARISSLVFGIASVVAVGFLARRLSAASAWMAAVVFAIFPSTLRYAVEARPYIAALFFSVVLTLMFLRLSDRPGLPAAVAYAVSAVLAIYTQPFAILVCGAHFLWAVLYRRWGAAVCAGAGGAIALAALVPWYLWARPLWADEISAQSWHFVFSLRTLLMLFRELAGAGYWGGGILLVLFVWGAVCSGMERRTMVLLMLLIAVPLVGGLLADAMFGYFLAARQFLWVLPAIAVTAASAWERHPRAAVALAILAAILCGYKSVRYFTEPEPDWAAAARAISAEVDRGACFRVAPAIAFDLYAYFVPSLARGGEACNIVVAATIPLVSPHDYDSLFEDLARRGYVVVRRDKVGGTLLTVMNRIAEERR